MTDIQDDSDYSDYEEDDEILSNDDDGDYRKKRQDKGKEGKGNRGKDRDDDDGDEEDEEEEDEEEEDEDEKDEDEDEDDEDDDEYRYQKMTPDLKKNMVDQYYPELRFCNNNQIQNLVKISRNEKGEIVDDLHKTTPIMTKFEKTRILGERAKQLQNGADPFLKDMQDVIDSYVIAEEELKQKVLPFIIERPLPFGRCEYWNVADLEIL